MSVLILLFLILKKYLWLKLLFLYHTTLNTLISLIIQLIKHLAILELYID